MSNPRAEELPGKFAIVYDLKLDDGAEKKQALFFGHDNHLPAVMQDTAQFYRTYPDALQQLPLAVRIGRKTDPDNLSIPYIVELPC